LEGLSYVLPLAYQAKDGVYRLSKRSARLYQRQLRQEGWGNAPRKRHPHTPPVRLRRLQQGRYSGLAEDFSTALIDAAGLEARPVFVTEFDPIRVACADCGFVNLIATPITLC
jgi:hypothetical protein